MATRIQTKANDAASASTISAAMDGNVTAGNKLVAICSLSENFTPSGKISDTQGNTWTLDWDASAGNPGFNCLGDFAIYSTTVGSTGACTVTFNPTVTGRIGLVVREFSGLGDHGGSIRSITQFGNSASPSSGNITPASADGVIFAFIAVNNEPTWEADYTDTTPDANGGRCYTAIDVSVTAAAQSAEGTISSTFWDCGAIWYPDSGAPEANIVPTIIHKQRQNAAL